MTEWSRSWWKWLKPLYSLYMSVKIHLWTMFINLLILRLPNEGVITTHSFQQNLINKCLFNKQNNNTTVKDCHPTEGKNAVLGTSAFAKDSCTLPSCKVDMEHEFWHQFNDQSLWQISVHQPVLKYFPLSIQTGNMKLNFLFQNQRKHFTMVNNLAM